MDIAAKMERYCPDAWLLNFTNPMSFLCTYLNKYTKVKTLGFCHLVHGTFGVIAEMLGMQPGDLEVITGGINHFNWLFDIRLKGTGKSYMEEFLQKIRDSEYWYRAHPGCPRQEFSLQILETFGMYPVGYDDHVTEYVPFFYEKHEWADHQCESFKLQVRRMVEKESVSSGQLEAMTLQGGTDDLYPFPKDNNHAYYAEKPTYVIEALETNTPAYFDAINIINHGSISNLPDNAVVDVPAVAVGGQVRGMHVGELSIAPMELCRRQITLHELIAKASVEGNPDMVVQSLCLDPWVRSITQARNIWKDYYEEYRDYLPQFNRY
jgi:alpha-galactosidase